MPVTVIRCADWAIVWQAQPGRHVYMRGVDVAFDGNTITYVGKDYAGPADRIVDGAKRMVMPGLTTSYAEADGSVGDRLCAYLQARARGGFGLIVVENIGVHPSGRVMPRMVMGHDDRYIPGLARLARHAGRFVCHGSLHSVRKIEVVADAGLEMARRNLAQLRHRFRAGRQRVWAAAAEHAAARRIGRARNVALEDLALGPGVGIGRGNGRQQGPRLRVLQR